MQSTDLPARFPIPFANNAGASYIRSIPTVHQAPSGSDAPASLYDGFPPETFTPETSGGVPPNGKDFNGILYQLSSWARWLAAGGPEFFNSAFCTSIGGYPKGAQLSSTVEPGLIWTSTAENNTTDPDGGSPAGWVATSFPFSGTIASPGQINLPLGLILKWGALALGSGSNSLSTTLTFASAFPTSCFMITGSPDMGANGLWHPIVLSFESLTASGCIVWADTANPAQAIDPGRSARWIAIGH